MEDTSLLGLEQARLVEVLLDRRSIRRWQNREVPEEALLRAISLATWAPNGGNQQAWKFYVIRSRRLIERVADAVQSRTEEMASWPEAQPFRDTVERWCQTSSFFRQAPACIAVLSSSYQSIADKLVAARGASDPVAREIAAARQQAGSRVQSVAAAIAYLLLALQAEGLGACWMTGPLQAKAQIEAILDGPAGYDLMALIPVGYPAEHPSPPPRKPLEEVVHVIR